MTLLLIVAAAGALVGGWVGYKVGRAYERVSPSKKDRRKLHGD